MFPNIFRRKRDPLRAFHRPLKKMRRAFNKSQYEKIDSLVEDVFATAIEWVEENPPDDWHLTVKASQCEDSADWDGAEAAYRRILDEHADSGFSKFVAHKDLSALYHLIGKDREALEHARLASEAVRGDDCSILVAPALQREAILALDQSDVGAAVSLIDEGLAMLDDDPMTRQIRASLLISRARVAIPMKRLSDAKQDLDQAFVQLEPLAAMDQAAGVHRDLACYWKTVAHLCEAKGNRDGAVEAWTEAMNCAAHVMSLPHAAGVYSPAFFAKKLHGLAEALASQGSLDEAEQVRNTRHEVIGFIGLPVA